MAQPKPWTEARWHAFIVSTLRAGTRRYPPKYLTLNDAKTEKKINKKTGRLAQHFLCTRCHEEFPASNIQVDHLSPVVGPEGFTTWDNFITNLFCTKENLQVLCKPCHSEKTQYEKGVRNKYKKHSKNK